MNKNSECFPNIIRGLWQLSKGHQIQDAALNLSRNISANVSDSIDDAINQGFTAFDCADIYLGVEELLGEVGSRYEKGKLRFHTKYVPDLDRLATLDFSYTQKIIERSLKRLRVESLDLVQFHWWDYTCPGYLEAVSHLSRLKDVGKIKAIGLTNFDSAHLEEIINAGFEISTIQLQASLIDKRSQGRMKELCEAHQIRRLGYGSLLGGFISETWLGKAEPVQEELANRSLLKYKLLIDDWGGWTRFQDFLHSASLMAKKYETSISQLVIQALLQSQLVDAVISGLSPIRYREQNRELKQKVRLSPKDLAQLLNWDSPLAGDVYQLERGTGHHASLMKYNLNQEGK